MSEQESARPWVTMKAMPPGIDGVGSWSMKVGPGKFIV